MSVQRKDVEKLLAPAYLEGLGDADVEDVRRRRDECKRVEDMLSYLRRVIQGQVDLVSAETVLRRGGTRGDAAQLVEDLPNILAGRPGRPVESGSPKPPIGAVHNMSALQEALEENSEELAPEEIAVALSPELAEALFVGGSLPGANLGSFTDAELTELGRKLLDQEHILSAQRRILQQRVDQLRAIIVERYKSGAADIDGLRAGNDNEPGP